MKVIVAKPYGPGFEALVKAQKHHGVLPTKLTEMIVHPQAARSTQNSYPFMPIASLASQKEPTYKPSQDTLQKELTYKPSQDTSTHHRSTRPTSVQNTPSQIGSAQAGTSQTSTTPPSSAVKIPRNQMGNAQAGTSQTSTTPPGLAVKIPRTQMGNAQVGTSQTSTTPPGSAEKIPRNNSGQRVDPRVNALAWVINASRKRKLCYEYHLQGYCTWSPKPCPNAHSTDSLNVHQLNALQVLARELPCYTGNECQDWACCFGHRCPYSGRCTKGRNCGFYREMHFTDLKVVN